MRFTIALPSVALAALLFSGCGESGDLKQGLPENVDLTKPAAIPAATPLMDPNAASKAGGSAPGGLAPVGTPRK